MKTCILIQLKNEHLYLKEWLDAHFDMGFDKVFIVEDIGSRTHKAITEPYGDKVEIHSYNEVTNDPDGRYYCKQDRSFEWFLDNHMGKGEFDWCMFIDVDEFLEFRNGETLESFLKDYSDVPAIAIHWKCYGANGHYKREKGTVEELYKSENNIIDEPQCLYTKIFVNLNHVERHHFYNIHTFDGAVDTDKRTVDFEKNQYTLRNYKRAWINHYRTKSYEDWVLKIRRGFVDDIGKNRKTLAKFWTWNPNMKRI